MDPTLIVLLFAVVAFAAALYYLYVERGWYDWGGRARAGIIVLVGVLAPVLVMTLWQQDGAKAALAAHGISIHPGLGSSVGIATGTIASGASWVFEFDGEQAALLDYYRDAPHRDGWEIAEDSDVLLILTKENQRLTISANDDTAIFQLGRLRASQ